jgi:hypothetical protein
LADELEEIDIGYSQALLARDINEAMSDPSYQPDQPLPLAEMVCRYGHVLFPARAFSATTPSDANAFRYQPRMVNKFPFGDEWQPGQPEGSAEWRQVSTAAGTIWYLPDVTGQSDAVSPAFGTLADARRNRLVQEQLELAYRLWLARQTELRAEQARMQQCRDELRRAFLAEKPVDHQADIWTAVVAAKTADAEVPIYCKSLRDLLRDCVRRQADDEEILRTAREVFAWSYTLLASEYFGKGPIKELTHAAQYYIAPNNQQFLNDCERAYRIALPAFQLDSHYKSFCESFHDVAKAKNSGLSNPNGNYDQKLEELRNNNHKFRLCWHPQSKVPQPYQAGEQFDQDLWNAGADVVELYLPVHGICASAFESLSTFWQQQVTNSGGEGCRLAFALTLYEAPNCDCYPLNNKPKYRRNYFSWFYYGNWTPDQLRVHLPDDVLAVFGHPYVLKCGILWVGFKFESGLTWAQYQPVGENYCAENWRMVEETAVFGQRNVTEVVNLLTGNAQNGCVWLLTFDSWYQG